MLFLLTLLSTHAFAADCPLANSPSISAFGGKVTLNGEEYPVGSPAEIIQFNELLQTCGLGELRRPLNAWRRDAELTKSGLIWLWPMVPVTFTLQNIHRVTFVTQLQRATEQPRVTRAD